MNMTKRGASVEVNTKIWGATLGGQLDLHVEMSSRQSLRIRESQGQVIRRLLLYSAAHEYSS